MSTLSVSRNGMRLAPVICCSLELHAERLGDHLGHLDVEADRLAVRVLRAEGRHVERHADAHDALGRMSGACRLWPRRAAEGGDGQCRHGCKRCDRMFLSLVSLSMVSSVQNGAEEGLQAPAFAARRAASAAGPSSWMRPSCMKTTREPKRRAKPISWVTRIMVMPLARHVLEHLEHLAGQFGVERRGDLVEQHQLGLHGERARDGDALLLAARELRRDRRRACPPGRRGAARRARARARPRRRHASSRRCGASVMLRATERCGNRLKLWNTMPTSLAQLAQVGSWVVDLVAVDAIAAGLDRSPAR